MFAVQGVRIRRRSLAFLMTSSLAAAGCSDGYDYPSGDYTDFQDLVQSRAGENALDCGVDPYLNYTAYGCVFDAFARGTSAFAYFIPPPEQEAQALVAQVDGGVYVFKYLSSVPPDGERGERVRLTNPDLS